MGRFSAVGRPRNGGMWIASASAVGLCIDQRSVGMIALTSQHRYHLYRRAVDMRKSFDGLSGVVRNELGRDPMDGEVYIFLNRQRSLVKLLVWAE